MDAVDGARIDASRVLGTNAGFCDYVSHETNLQTPLFIPIVAGRQPLAAVLNRALTARIHATVAPRALPCARQTPPASAPARSRVRQTCRRRSSAAPPSTVRSS